MTRAILTARQQLAVRILVEAETRILQLAEAIVFAAIIYCGALLWSLTP